MALANLAKQTGPRLFMREDTAATHRLATHDSFLCAAKPFKWIFFALFITDQIQRRAKYPTSTGKSRGNILWSELVVIVI